MVLLLEHSSNPGNETRIPPCRRENPPIRAEIPWNHGFRPECPPKGVMKSKAWENRRPPWEIHTRVRHLPAGKYGGQRRSLGRPRRSMRSDSAIATTAIVTFGRGVQPLISGATIKLQDSAYRAVADAICRRYDVGLRGLVADADEAAPHAHNIFDCRSGDGRAVSKQLRGGELQDLAAAAIRPHFPEVTCGVSRAIRKEAGEPKSKWVHRSVRRLNQDLPAEIAGLEALPTAAEDSLKAARDREAWMEGRVRKLEAKEASLGEGLTERETKRLETYRKRLGDSQEELWEAEVAASPAREELSSVQEQLKTSEAARDAARKETEALTDRPLSDAGPLTGGHRGKEREIENRAIREAARKGAAHQRREQALEERFATRTQELEARADKREEALDERAAELDRRESAIGKTAEDLVRRTATAVQAIAEELVAPYPVPGDWRRGPRFDQKRWNQLKPLIGNRGGSWPARIWGKLRGLHTQVRAAKNAAEKEHGTARDEAVSAKRERDARLTPEAEAGLRGASAHAC